MPRYPFSPELLDALPEELAELFRSLEIKLLEDICSRLKLGGPLTLLPPANAYQWALDNAELQVQSGAVSYDQAIAEAVRELAASGLKTVSYESGHVDSVDVAVRRAVMTGVNQLNQKYREQSMEYLETDLVEVTAHSGARDIDGPMGWENHKAWQGKVYRWRDKPRASKGDYPDFEDTCGLGSVTGIGGANCKHSYWPFIEGFSERTYTDEELADIDPPPFEFEGRTYTAYQATQKQREIERTIRKQKRLKAAYKAAGLTDEANAAGAKLRRLNQKYREFCKAAGLPEEWERARMGFVDEASEKRAAERLEKQTESGIIEQNRSKEIPEVSKMSMPPTKMPDRARPLLSSDVTQEYLNAAAPGQGTITYDDGYNAKGHQDEIKMAHWLHDTFGGDIKLLKESDMDSIKMSDYMWKGKLWELKGTASINGADKLLQHAIKQIQGNPGGVILNISEDMSIPALERQLTSRIKRSRIDTLDLMILLKGEFAKVLRYTK